MRKNRKCRKLLKIKEKEERVVQKIRSNKSRTLKSSQIMRRKERRVAAKSVSKSKVLKTKKKTTILIKNSKIRKAVEKDVSKSKTFKRNRLICKRKRKSRIIASLT